MSSPFLTIIIPTLQAERTLGEALESVLGQQFGDLEQVLVQIAPRRVLIAAGVGGALREEPSVSAVAGRFSQDPRILTHWIGD